MRKVLIIGSQGYLGSHLTGYLNERGYQCTGMDIGFFKDGVFYNPEPVETIDKDARTVGPMDIEGFDAVILLAGISNDPFGHMTSEQIYDPTRDYAVAIAKMCKEMGIQFVYPSSCSIYGAALSDGHLSETSEVNPQTPYSINKVQVEEELTKLVDDKFSPIALRFGTVYGMSPRIRFDVVINMLCGLALTTGKVTLNSNGKAWRPNLHIDDACEAFKCSLDWNPSNGKLNVFNVGNHGDNYQIIDIAKIIHGEVAGAELTYLGQGNDGGDSELIKDRKIQDGVDTRTYKVSFDKIHNEMPGFKCKWTVETGIKHLIKELKRVELDKDSFGRREFYRLQQIEHLHASKQIDDDLIWTK